MKKRIPINIWDDYYDDGFVPAGKKQETSAYVEDHEIPDAEKSKILKVVYDYISNHRRSIGLPSEVVVEFNEGEGDIYFTNLTHVARQMMVKSLGRAKLKYEGREIYFYSES